MNSDTFFEIEENLVQLNAAFKIASEVLSVDDMFATLEEFVGHDIKGFKDTFQFLNTQKHRVCYLSKDISF
jgi:hypothetical protein